jgi:Ser/Thr protein kinase RdoA (MazF antagonist)
MLTFLRGRVLAELPHASRPLRDLGATVARLGHALRDFFHPAADHELLWDMKQAAQLREHVRHIEDTRRRSLADGFLEHFESRLLPVLPGLRAQVIHNDVSLQNTLVDPNEDRIAGVIDFGDLVHAPLVCDVAVTVSEVILGASDPVAAALEVVAGYNDVEPLREEERTLLFELVTARLAMVVVISAWRVERHPENRDYISGDDGLVWVAFERLAGLGDGMRRDL